MIQSGSDRYEEIRTIYRRSYGIYAAVCRRVRTRCYSGGYRRNRSPPAAAQTAAAAAAEPTAALLQLTLEELKQYDGQNGNPAYVAVDGVIYDMTNVPEWKGGKHNGYTAGQDLTDIIKNKSPHGLAKLQGVPVVGELIG